MNVYIFFRHSRTNGSTMEGTLAFVNFKEANDSDRRGKYFTKFPLSFT
jgi:hypothetical protein